MPQESLPPRRALPYCAAPAHDGKPLYIPHRPRHVPAYEWTNVDAPIKPNWRTLADQKGFQVHSRIRDRLHLALECKTCGALTAHKLHTLRSAHPACGGCQHRARTTAAQAAGLAFLARDPDHRHHGYYRAACGHIVRRNFGFIARLMHGEVDLRCEDCLALRDAADAREQGWTLLSDDPAEHDKYRLYEHGCGHQQRVARVNMQWGQVDCAKCGTSWTARRSYLYLVRLTWTDTRLSVIKLGYSATPAKRFRHQLGLSASARLEILQLVAIPTGHMACVLEKTTHADLRRRFSGAVIPPAAYAGRINVVTEIYRPTLTAHIQARLDQIARDHPFA